MLLQTGAVVRESTASGDVIHVFGDLDRDGVAELDEVLQRVICLDNDVTIDLTRCRYIGSLGIRALLRARQDTRGAFATLVDRASAAARLLHIAKVQDMLGVTYAAEVHSGELHSRPDDEERIHIIRLDGEWDLSRGNELREHLEAAVTHPRVVIDMSKVRYMDQYCVGMLLRARTQRVARGYPQAHVVLANGNVRRVLGVARFHELWNMCETLDEALAAAQ